MEVVQNFNKEMKGLLDHRPPVSRQKMSMITKSAIRGIKFYKHIVQSVEKFIQKCSPDFKVPGLYVMDAIIRQSRHQYGAERDVFAPRFLKNLLPTFQQLLRCDEKDRPLVLRVLNLWLKNETFPPDVVEGLIALFECDDHDPEAVAAAESRIAEAVAAHGVIAAPSQPHESQERRQHKQKPPRHRHHRRDNNSNADADVLGGDDPLQFTDQGDEDLLESGAGGAGAHVSMATPPLGGGFTAASAAAAAVAGGMPQGGLISSVAELLQKFQGTEDVRDQINQLQSLQDKILQQSSLLSQQQMIDPEILGQLQALMEELTKTARLAVEREQEARRAKDVVAFDYGDSDDDDENILGGGRGAGGGGVVSTVDRNFLDQLQQMTETLAQTRVLQEQLQAARLRQQQTEEQQHQFELTALHQHQQQQQHQHQHQQQQQEEGEIRDEARAGHVNMAQASSSSASKRSRRRGSSRSRSPSERRRKERKRRSMPRLRDGRVSVVSATIFVGKLSKSTMEPRLRSVLDEFGTVQELVLIASRGCAFVIFSKRKHAAKALEKLRTNRLDGATLRVAWAPNKGIKDTELREFWDEVEGCTYVPCERFPRGEDWRDLLIGGAFIDTDSVPPELSDLLSQPQTDSSVAAAAAGPVMQAAMSMALPAHSMNYPPPPPPPLPPPQHPGIGAMIPGMPPVMQHQPPQQQQMLLGLPPQFSQFIPPPPLPPTAISSDVKDASAVAATVPKPLQPPPQPPPQPLKTPQLPLENPPSGLRIAVRPTLLPRPPHQPPHQPPHHLPHQRPPPPPPAFFRGGINGAGIMPPHAFPPMRGGAGGGGWRGGWRGGGM